MSYIKSMLIAVVCVLTSMTVFAQEYVPGEVIIKYKKSNNNGLFNIASKATASKFVIKKSWDSMGIQHVRSKQGANQDVAQMLNQLKSDPNIEFAEPNYVLRKQSTGIEGQPLSLSQVREVRAERIQQSSLGAQKMSSSSVSTLSSSYIQCDADIQIEDAWNLMNPAQTFIPVVAVIDSGVDYNHEVFTGSNAIWTNPGEIPGNGIDDDNNGYIDDVRGWNFVSNNNNPMDDEDHGTHVAGIVLGVTQDIFSLPMTPAVIRIMPLKFLDNNGSGSTSDAIEAIYYAVENGASVINASWGGGGFSQALQNAIADAYANQVSFVAAAGNSRLNNDSNPTYPANYNIPSVMSIAATNDSDLLAAFSNYGKQSVHIASPGVSILSTLPNNSYANASGTSMATPIVAGIVALMEREHGQSINGYQASQIIFGENDTSVGNISGKVKTDSRVNAFKAVSYVQNNGVSNYQPAANATRAIASASAGGGGCGLIAKLMRDQGKGDGGSGDLFGRALLMLIVLSPFVLAIALKQRRKDEENRRSHQRYNITSEVRISVGDKQLVGSVSSISLGGVKINTEAMLEQGGIVEMNIMSPDGKEKVQVLGKVVWSQERKSYGVQFCDMAETQTNSISTWTKKLVKAS